LSNYFANKSALEQSGAFLADAQVWEEPLMSHINDENAERLWEMSENLVGQKFCI